MKLKVKKGNNFIKVNSIHFKKTQKMTYLRLNVVSERAIRELER